MPIIAKADSTNYEPVSQGVHIATCISMIALGTQKSIWNDQEKQQKKVWITWEIQGEMIEVDGEDKPRVIGREYTLSLSDKARLRADLEAWRNKPFSTEDLNGFDICKILGTSCQLQIMHTDKNGRTYANIKTVMALPKGTERPVPINDPFAFTLDNPSSLDLMDRIPEWIKDKIKQSPEYLELVNSQIEDDDEFAEVLTSEEDLPF